MSTKLNPNDLQEQLDLLNSKASTPWVIHEGKLHKQFEFKNFICAFGFMTQIAIHAEKANHHPEWSNVYKIVTVHLTTHEADGITDKDFSLALEMERISNL